MLNMTVQTRMQQWLTKTSHTTRGWLHMRHLSGTDCASITVCNLRRHSGHPERMAHSSAWQTCISCSPGMVLWEPWSKEILTFNHVMLHANSKKKPLAPVLRAVNEKPWSQPFTTWTEAPVRCRCGVRQAHCCYIEAQFEQPWNLHHNTVSPKVYSMKALHHFQCNGCDNRSILADQRVINRWNIAVQLLNVWQLQE